MFTQHFVDEDFQALVGAQTYGDLAKIACRCLSKMHGPIIQVCGPITTGGRGPEYNHLLFWWTIHRLASRLGYTVFDQMIFQQAMRKILQILPKTDYPWGILEEFYRPILRDWIDIAVFLPGWKSSKGSCRERDFCQEFRILCIDLPQEYPDMTDEELRKHMEKGIHHWWNQQNEYP